MDAQQVLNFINDQLLMHLSESAKFKVQWHLGWIWVQIKVQSGCMLTTMS